MNYNTKRTKLLMPEYGRHLQDMVDYLKTIEDKTERQKNAEAVIKLMGDLNPHLKNVDDFKHILWDHLFYIADFDLDIESPYPIPTQVAHAAIKTKLPYPEGGKTHRHLGKNILVLIDIAAAEEDEEKRDSYTKAIAYCMKLAYNNWHKEQANDEMIKNELDILSGGVLDYTPGDVKLKLSSRHKKSRSNQRNNNRSNNHRKRSYQKKKNY